MAHTRTPVPAVAVTAATPQLPRFVPYLSLSPRRAWSRADAGVAVLLFISSLALYTSMLAPTLSALSLDSNEFATKSALRIPAHMPGSPFYIFLGYLFTRLPFGEVATRVNWMSAVMAAATLAILYLVTVRHLTGERLSAAGATALFGLSITFWSQAVVAELYAPSMALLTLALLGVLEWAAARDGGGRGQVGRGRWWLVLAAGAFAFSLGIHLSNVLYLPAIALFALLGWPVRHRTRTRTTPLRGNWLAGLWRHFDKKGAALAVLVGVTLAALPYAKMYFALHSVVVFSGDEYPKAAAGWPFFYEYVFNAFSKTRFAFSWQQLPDRVALFLHLLWLNLGPVGLVLMFLGLWRLLFTRLRLFYLLVPAALANLAFFIDYGAYDVDVFFIPAYWAAACTVAMGLQTVMVGVRGLVRVRSPRDTHAAAPRAATTFGIRAGVAGTGIPAPVSWPGLVAVLLALLGATWNWQTGYALNDMARDLSFRDFYGNMFPMLPEGANLYQHGGSMGDDVLYYTQAYGVRPDLHVQVGSKAGESPQQPWPPTETYSLVNRRARVGFLPAFIAQPMKAQPRWFDPLLAGFSPWRGNNLRLDWLTLYKVRHQPPPKWVLPAGDPRAQPSQKLDIHFSPTLTLLGIDAEPQAERGRPWHLVRYWRNTTSALPRVATVLGSHAYVEAHIPLYGQLGDYMAAKGIEEKDVGNYVIREDLHLVIPSNIAPGRYTITTSRARPQLTDPMVDMVSPTDALRGEEVITTVEVVDNPAAPALDPLTMGNSTSESGSAGR